MALTPKRRYRRAVKSTEEIRTRFDAIAEASPSYIVNLDEEQRQAHDSFGKDRTADEIKREITLIRNRLEIIQKLKHLEKPFKARLKTLEKCLSDLEKVKTLLVSDIEVVTNESSLAIPDRDIELTPEEENLPVNNLKDFK